MTIPYEERLKNAQGIYEQGMERVATTPAPIGQKFSVGAFVWIDKNLSPCMSHFENNRPARVKYTYSHAYGGNNIREYSLLVRYDDGKWSSVSWYYEEQLTEITDVKKITEYRAEIKRGTENEILNW